MSKARQLADNGAATPNRNMVINGAMNVSQRKGTTEVTGLGGSDPAYTTMDRWRMNINSTSAGRFKVQQVADGPSGFLNCLKISCTTADTSIAAGELLSLQQRFEGQNLQRLKKGTSDAEKISVSFWVKGNASATYTCELEDADNTRNSCQQFSVTTSWNRVELIFTGDTSGALDDDTNHSFALNFFLHAGSTYTSGSFVSNTWGTISNAVRMSDSQTSIFDATSRTFFITGVQMEVGEPTPFEHEDIGTTLRKCYRYTQRVPPSDETSGSGYNILGDGYNNTATENLALCTHYEIMRADPSIESQSGSFRVHIDNTAVACSSAITMDDNTSSKHNTNLIGTVSSGLTAAEGSYLEQSNDVDAHIILSAEL
jgi:hypothetical protein